MFGCCGDHHNLCLVVAAILCPVLLDPANGMVDVRGRTMGSQAVYTCDQGFAPNGLIVRTCTETGEWTGEDTECIDTSTVMCPLLSDPMDGQVSIMSNGFNGGAIYSCINGFSLSGFAVRICMADGEWSGTPPTCLGKREWSVFSCHLSE